MELKEGMYVRTDNNGVSKIKFINNDFLLLDKTPQSTFKRNVIKASYDIIDLIEVGDLIETKFDGIVEIIKDNKGNLCYLLADYEPSTHYLTEKDIKQILTHEEFENRAYKVD